MHNLESGYTNLVKKVRSLGYYPDPPIVDSAPSDAEIFIGGKKYLHFASNNYFGLSTNISIKKAATAAIMKYGLGSGGPRLFAGTTDIQVQLENSVSKFLKRPACITFTTGFMANTGVIPAIVNPFVLTSKKDLLTKLKNKNDVIIFSDQYNHGSVADGVRLSKSEKYVYRHVDVNDLESNVKKHKRKDKIIITDGVFSMEGDIAPLPQIAQIAKDNNCLLMVDDAHGIGVLGKTGKGTIEHYGMKNEDVHVLIGTFTKAFGGIGGFATGSANLIDYLRISARTYILSAPIPPGIVAGLIEAVSHVKNGDQLRDRALKNARYFKDEITKIGLKITNTQSLIVPVVIGDEKKCLWYTNELFKRGIFVPSARYPSVPLGESRLRFVITSMHTKKQIDFVISELLDLLKNEHKK